jgi:hypothetical protein
MTRPTVEHVEPDRAEVDAFDRSCLDLAKGSVRASQRHGSSMRCTRSLARASGPVKDHRLTISHDETTGMLDGLAYRRPCSCVLEGELCAGSNVGTQASQSFEASLRFT